MRCQDGIFGSVEFPFIWVSDNMPNEMSIIYLQNCLSILYAKERRGVDDCRFPSAIDNPINILIFSSSQSVLLPLCVTAQYCP